MTLRFVLIGLLLAPGLLMAQPLDAEKGLYSARNELAALQEQLNEAVGNTLQARRQISVLRKRLITIRSQARDCISDAVTKVTALAARREALGSRQALSIRRCSVCAANWMPKSTGTKKYASPASRLPRHPRTCSSAFRNATRRR